MNNVLWVEWVGHWPPAWLIWFVLLTAALFELAHVKLNAASPHICRHRYVVASRTVILLMASLAPLAMLGYLLEARSFSMVLVMSVLLVFGFSSWLRDILLTVVIAFDQRLRTSNDPHDAGMLRIGEFEGLVEGFRLGRIVLRNPSGALFAIPASHWFNETVSVPGEGFGDAVCNVVFEVKNPGDLEAMKETLRFLSMTSIYASPRHRPEVFWLGATDDLHRFKVTTFASRSQLREHFVADIQERFRHWEREPKHADPENS